MEPDPVAGQRDCVIPAPADEAQAERAQHYGATLFEPTEERIIESAHNLGNSKFGFIPEPFAVRFPQRIYNELFSHTLWSRLAINFVIGCCIFDERYLASLFLFLVNLILTDRWISQKESESIDMSARAILNDQEKLRAFLQAVQTPQAFQTVLEHVQEATDWLNVVLNRFWPYVNSIAQEEIDKRGFHLGGLKIDDRQKLYFDRLTLGDTPPNISSIRVNKHLTRNDEIVLDLKIIFSGNCYFSFRYARGKCFTASAGKSNPLNEEFGLGKGF